MTLHKEALELRKKIIATAPEAYKQELKGKPWEIALLCAESYFKSLQDQEQTTDEVAEEVEQESEIKPSALEKIDLRRFLTEYIWYDKICKDGVSAEILLNRFHLSVEELSELADILGYTFSMNSSKDFVVINRINDANYIQYKDMSKIPAKYHDIKDIVDLANTYKVSADSIYFLLWKARGVDVPMYLCRSEIFVDVAERCVTTGGYRGSVPASHLRLYSHLDFSEINSLADELNFYKQGDSRDSYLQICPQNVVLIPECAVRNFYMFGVNLSPDDYSRFGISSEFKGAVSDLCQEKYIDNAIENFERIEKWRKLTLDNGVLAEVKER